MYLYSGGLLVLILDIVALIDLLGGAGSAQHKILWLLVILLLPLLGPILYFLLGRDRAVV
ncbi:MAG: PLDc N-terminal domain-containing protein [Phycisphaerae bacterium]|nr:PLDc N-terminal domain-containing protein [Phycisphaerae bacterium]